MPVPILSAALWLLLTACCTTAAPLPAPDPVPVPFVLIERTQLAQNGDRVVALLPALDTIELVLAHGQRAGITLGDRGYAPCHDAELRIIEVFEFRSRALMKRPDTWPRLNRVRIYLHGADPQPWCPDPDPQPSP
ncbi:MAG TPA: hypothetical protein PK095_04915 [Myxococcota bacterium]|nr:hypothetical protein [Myxococcota bacterium]